MSSENLPRVKPEDVENAIGSVKFITHERLTLCVITMKNGFMVTGESVCVHPDLYNQEVGETLSKNRAKEKIWTLLGYVLRERIHQSGADNFLGRLFKERDDLVKKITALDAFRHKQTFSDLPLEDQSDLLTQRAIMGSYIEILETRINRLKHNQKTG
jgi:Phage protein (N4 Gp49/phage Sf6 gene 66) family